MQRGRGVADRCGAPTLSARRCGSGGMQVPRTPPEQLVHPTAGAQNTGAAYLLRRCSISSPKALSPGGEVVGPVSLSDRSPADRGVDVQAEDVGKDRRRDVGGEGGKG